ncbi:MAG: hypothetical protein Q4D41_07310 [Prevotellaceae bacterium]|nr:hypothetical protein [Prevotellaceae bacterium]
MILNVKRFTLAIIMAIAIIPFSSAQNNVEDQKKEINKIKKNSSYIYSEATLANKQEAIDLAKDLLYQNINEWVAKQKKFADASKVVTVNTNYSVEEMTLPRGNMHRAFMYVKKTDIIPVTNVSVTDLYESKVEDTNANTENATTGSAQTETEQKPETSSYGIESEQFPITTGDNANNTVEGNVSVNLSEANITEVNEENNLGGNKNINEKSLSVMNELIKSENTGQLSVSLKQLKQDGKITEYNKLSALKNPDEYVMVIFTSSGNVEAVLSEGPDRTNISTGNSDKISNYKGRGAIGVKINK